MNKPLLVTLLVSVLTGCETPLMQADHANHQISSAHCHTMESCNAAFDQFKDEFLTRYWAVKPEEALYMGYYQHDQLLVVPNDESRKTAHDFEDDIYSRLKAFDLAKLSSSNSVDFAIIKNQLDSSRWYREVFKQHQWDPSVYNVAGAFSVILNTDYKPLTERLETIFNRLELVPDYYQAAMETIGKATLEHTELAISQNQGGLSVFEQDIPKAIVQASLSAEQKTRLHKRLEQAIAAIKDYVNWLGRERKQLAAGAGKDFRIGEALYEQKFKLDIVSDYSAKQLYERALAAKVNLHQQMITLTSQLWPRYFPQTAMPTEPLKAVKQLIDHLSQRHVSRDDFVDEVKRQMPIIEQFIVDKDLLDMDPTRPLVVRETPAYMRGFSVASVNSPGPYDATANTYYNVEPLDGLSDERAQSHLREYNHWILQVLNIHEALPGHYTQLLHANKSPSLIKSIFGNGAMVEGWAVYSERMMLEAGYGNDDPEMWLMYSKWNLRVVVNTLLDYSIHVLGMQREQALDLLMNEAFQERTEAEGKWRRATLSQVQLTSYFNGYSEIYAFREQMKQKLGKDFDLKAFHNQFLSYGSAPVPVIKQLMLGGD